MFRESLPEDYGMLFVFEIEAVYPFWMKNMKFALDIIWIGKNSKVVDIRTHVLPCQDECQSIIPVAEALYVLEVPAGFCAQRNISVGQEVSIPNPLSHKRI